jgi:hypothetical protein
METAHFSKSSSSTNQPTWQLNPEERHYNFVPFFKANSSTDA